MIDPPRNDWPELADIAKLVNSWSYSFVEFYLRNKAYLCLFSTVLSAGIGFGQASKAAPVQQPPAKQSGKAQQRPRAVQPKLPPQKQFVVDVVRMAVALPQPDPQDRLRVLTAAVNVVGPVNSAMAKDYAREGARIEADLIAGGQKPAVSILSAGHFDCAGAVPFIERIPASSVADAEQSLISLLSSCPNQATEPVRQKLEAALNDGTLAARGILAMMERSGPKSAWSQANFAKMFHTLPSDPEKQRGEAPNYAAMFNRMAPEVGKDVARDAGLRFLEWLGKLSEGGERNLAVNMTVDTLKQVLGDEGYGDAMRSNLVARDVANSAGQPGEVEHPEEENVSVLAAMGEVGKDRSEDLAKMPPSLRAREAAAHGFATGTSGDLKGADRYFDVAFSALDDVWNNRSEQNDAPGVVQEVSEAAAQVNAVAALKRTQALGDP
ncbi:MAG TPA: hypothetical protein VFM10_10465, partial [Terriglobales bacterium]|nr:hypothetical protein [Terriglobales bacterium]